MGLIGRRSELAELDALLDDVRRGTHADRGLMTVVRGRRRVGKSRLVAEFVAGCGVPSFYVEAARGSQSQAELLALADAVPPDQPSVVVVDDVSWLLSDSGQGLDALRSLWDRQLAARPVLLLLLGSDTAAMDQLSRPPQPWRGRSATLVVEPLSPAGIAEVTGLSGFDAFDAHLITGGYPLVVQEWERGMSRDEFLRTSLARSTSALVVAGARLLAGSLPETTYARAVLSAIGGRGDRTFTSILNSVSDGSMSRNSVTANLETLSATGLITADEPLSLRPAPKDRRWRVADPALGFWLTFVEPALGEVDRGQPEAALHRVDTGFGAWRDRAVEPVVRDALVRLLPDSDWQSVRRVGGWWPRSNTPELALVGVDDAPASRIGFVGALAWRASGALSAREITRLAEDALRVPGADVGTPLVAVCPGGCDADERISRAWTADDLLAAWA